MKIMILINKILLVQPDLYTFKFSKIKNKTKRNMAKEKDGVKIIVETLILKNNK